MSDPVIICAALTGAATFKQNNPSVPYTLSEFAAEAEKCHRAGAAIVHVHARTDDGDSTHEIERVQAVHDIIKERCPDLIVCLSSAVGAFKTAEQRLPDHPCQARDGLSQYQYDELQHPGQEERQDIF